MLEPIDIFVIEKVKEKRIERGISQSQLAHTLDVSNGFIGMVESKKYLHKYSIAQLNKIAVILDCKLWDLFPEYPLK